MSPKSDPTPISCALDPTRSGSHKRRKLSKKIATRQLTFACAAATVAIGSNAFARNLLWNNSLNNAGGDGVTWDIFINQNWQDGEIPTWFANGDDVFFTDNNNHHYNVKVNMPVAPNSVTINANNGTYVFSGPFDIGGPGSIAKDGTAEMDLMNANTFAGSTTLNGGTIGIGNAAALGTGSLVINGGALDNVSGAAVFINNFQVWNGSFGFVGTAPLGGNGNVLLNGNITLAVSGSNLTLAGSIAEGPVSGSITKNGAGTLTLSAANTFTGGTTLNAGTLAVNNAGALGSGPITLTGGSLDNTSGASVSISGNPLQVWNGSLGLVAANPLNMGSGNVLLSGDSNLNVTLSNFIVGGTIADNGGPHSITKTGPGTLTLSGNNTFSGGLTLSAGTIAVNSPGALGTGTITFTSGSLDNTSGASVSISGNPLQVWNGSLGFVSANPLNMGSGNVLLSGNSSLNVTLSNFIVGGNISDSGGTPHSITKSGQGTLTLSGNNTFSGGLSVNGGTLAIGSPNALGTGPVTLSNALLDNTTGASLNINGNPIQIWNGTLGFVSSNPLNIGNGNIALASNVNVSVTQSNFIAGGVISDDGSTPRRLIKSGQGTLTLAGANTFSGGVSLNQGTLAINNPGALGTGNLAISNAMLDNTTGASVSVAGNPIQIWNGTLGLVSPNPVNIGAGNVALGSNVIANITLSNFIVGGTIANGSPTPRSITKIGQGTLTLAGANTFSGGINLNQGTLAINNPAALGTGTLSITNAMLDNSSGASISVTGNPIQIWNGSLGLVSSNPLNMGNGTISLANNTDLFVASSTLTEGGSISDGNLTLSLSKSGAGTLVLAGANTYKGGTTVNAGKIIAASSTALGAGPLTIHNTGSVQLALNVATAYKLGSISFDHPVAGSSAFLDITNDKLIVQDSANHAATLASINSSIGIGVGATAGITDSTIAAGQPNFGKQTIAIDNATAGLASFGNVAVNAGSILVLSVYAGDTNLDGKVNINDLNNLGSHWLASGVAWTAGDLNGDGKVNIADLNILGSHWLNGGAEDSGALAIPSTDSSVPEPTSFSTIVAGAVALALARRRRAIKVNGLTVRP